MMWKPNTSITFENKFNELSIFQQEEFLNFLSQQNSIGWREMSQFVGHSLPQNL